MWVFADCLSSLTLFSFPSILCLLDNCNKTTFIIWSFLVWIKLRRPQIVVYLFMVFFYRRTQSDFYFISLHLSWIKRANGIFYFVSEKVASASHEDRSEILSLYVLNICASSSSIMLLYIKKKSTVNHTCKWLSYDKWVVFWCFLSVIGLYGLNLSCLSFSMLMFLWQKWLVY